ncbi:general stress protein [Luteococcus peritonei]|uniref:General stress protein n=1 Tax=Luteococcus peritonei TaxID=88874 RepID=A0ABW4RYY2_9ACTN
MSSSMQAASMVMPLKYPMSVAIYPTYAEAQRAVDHLADADFPVQHLCIVGTDLKQVERVLGRRTWGRVLAEGMMSGIGTGLFFGLVLMLLMPQLSAMQNLGLGLLMGLGMGVLSAGMAHAAQGGRRDFASAQAIVASRYEVLGEHTVVNQARQMLGQAPLQPQAPTTWPPTPHDAGPSGSQSVDQSQEPR